MKKSFSWLIWKILWERKIPFEKRECWFCLPALKWLNSIDISDYRILEFGGGSSTLYFSDHAKEVETIETNKDYKSIISDKLINKNHKFVSKPKGFYDLILVDSSNDRIREFQVSKKHLTKKGLIIFDNVDKYKPFDEQMDFVFKGWAKQYAGIVETGVKK